MIVFRLAAKENVSQKSQRTQKGLAWRREIGHTESTEILLTQK
jgi:hypothetical protein